MGQKSNLFTLRPKEKFLHLQRSNNIEFLYGFYFSMLIKFLFNTRKIFITSLNLNFLENKIFISLDLFYRVAKLLFFKKTKLINKCNTLISFQVFKSLSFLKKKLIIYRFNVVNFKIKQRKKILFDIFKVNKRYAFSIFPRRFNFFLDFLKLSILFKKNIIKASFFITVLGEIFRILQKKKHSKFLFFFIKFFKGLMEIQSLRNEYDLLGIKFIIKGKLKGKRRKSNSIINIGQIPVQSLYKHIEFSKTHAFTVYGTFGLKLWVYRSKN
jgi:hypothetical protein